jgi:roadblock/LC7 domain-containing protein
MATLTDLAKLDGVVLAFEFAPDGRLLCHEANTETSPEMAAMAAQFCASVTMSFNTLAGAFSRLSHMPWVPQQGWAYSGGEYTVAIGGNGYCGVFIKTASADFNQLFRMLVGNP